MIILKSFSNSLDFEFQMNKIKMIIILTLIYRIWFLLNVCFFTFFLLMSKIILYRQYLLYLPNSSLISQFIQETFQQSSKYNVKTFTLVINNDNLHHWTVLSNIRAFYVYAFVWLMYDEEKWHKQNYIGRKKERRSEIMYVFTFFSCYEWLIFFSKVQEMQNLSKFFFLIIFTWLDRACKTVRKNIFKIFFIGLFTEKNQNTLIHKIASFEKTCLNILFILF